MLNDALHLVERGFPVLPLLPRDKRPYYELLPEVDGEHRWGPLRDGVEPADVRRWFDHDPEANIGIITGRGLVVADVDHIGKLNGHGFPVTPMAKTSRGYHVYLDGRGLDIRDGAFGWGDVKASGYVVAPPSVHESGARYTWYPFLSYADVPLARVPASLLQEIQTKTKTATRKNILSCCSLGTRGYPAQSKSAPRKNILSGCSLEVQTWASLGKGAYGELAGDWEVASAILQRCGVTPKGPGKAFRCVLPGHEERQPSAALWKPEGGFIGYHDFHQVSGRAWWPLPDVYAACVTGQARELGKGERAIWWLRALHDIGAIEVPAIPHHELPEDANKSVHKLYDGFIHLLELRKAYDAKQTQAAPYSYRFAQGWCGIGSLHTVQDGMVWLFKRGYIYKCGETTGKRIGLLALGKPRPPKAEA